jgi:plasmid stabilization system protein ParE
MQPKSKRLEYSDRAISELADAVSFIAMDSPAGAERVRKRVYRVYGLIQAHPEAGAPGKLPGTRDWPVAKTSLTITYRILESRIRILRVRHQSRMVP